MSRLFIALGLPDRKAESEPAFIYAGRDGAAMARALAASPHPVHLTFARPQGGIIKHNEQATANASRPPADDAVVIVSGRNVAEYRAEMAKLVELAGERSAAADRLAAHVEDLQARIAARVAEADVLNATIAELKAKLAASESTSVASAAPSVERADSSPATVAEESDASGASKPNKRTR
jgi:hypothetical protein